MMLHCGKVRLQIPLSIIIVAMDIIDMVITQFILRGSIKKKFNRFLNLKRKPIKLTLSAPMERHSLHENGENSNIQGILAARRFVTPVFAARGFSQGFKSLVLTVEFLLLAVFF